MSHTEEKTDNFEVDPDMITEKISHCTIHLDDVNTEYENQHIH